MEDIKIYTTIYPIEFITSRLYSDYSDIESTFCSQDFYFRAGYVAGYGVFKQDPDLE